MAGRRKPYSTYTLPTHTARPVAIAPCRGSTPTLPTHTARPVKLYTMNSYTLNRIKQSTERILSWLNIMELVEGIFTRLSLENLYSQLYNITPCLVNDLRDLQVYLTSPTTAQIEAMDLAGRNYTIAVYYKSFSRAVFITCNLFNISTLRHRHRFVISWSISHHRSISCCPKLLLNHRFRRSLWSYTHPGKNIY
jgi:hypothetical protein